MPRTNESGSVEAAVVELFQKKADCKHFWADDPLGFLVCRHCLAVKHYGCEETDDA